MKKILSRPLFWIALVAAALIAVSVLSDPGAPQPRAVVFGPAPDVTAAANLTYSPNGFPEISVSLHNRTDKELLAAGFYAVPRDRNGNELTDWTARRRFSTDASLKPGVEAAFTFQSIQENVASVELWICSLTFADGTRWGDPDCNPADAMEKGISVPVEKPA